MHGKFLLMYVTFGAKPSQHYGTHDGAVNFIGTISMMSFAGRSWFDRFAVLWKHLVEFKSREEILRIANDPISMKKWVYECDNYTRIQKFTKSFCNRSYIFIAEVAPLCMEGMNKIDFKVVVSM